MSKPVLPPLPKVTKKAPFMPRRTRPSVQTKREPSERPARKLRDPARVEAAKQEFVKWTEEQGLEKAALDKKVAENAAKVLAMRADQEESEKKSGALTIDEQVLILQAHFENGIGVKVIAGQLGRNHSTVSRFLSKYKSTSTLAKMHLQNNAEKLARRVSRDADVDQSLEILDRLDVLPKKDRGKSMGGDSFQVIVNTPTNTVIAAAMPSQKAIEAAIVKAEEEEK